MKAYTDYHYLWPPRPDNALPPDILTQGYYCDGSWAAQVKKNGTANVIFVSPDREVICRTRHMDKETGDGVKHKMWEPSSNTFDAFKHLTGKGWYVFVAELLNNKVTGGAKDTNYLFDMLVDDGNHLTGVPFQERIDRMMEIFYPHVQDETYSHFLVDDKFWLARPMVGDFKALWDDLIERGNPEDEGLVLKRLNGKLARKNAQTANGDKMVKVRLPHKNYAF